MIKASKLLFWISLSTLLFSCEKEEMAIPKHAAGDVTTNSVAMESDYRYQLFFDFEMNTVVKQNLKTDWDLGFETNGTGFHVILNTSKAMFAANTLQTDFSAITDTIGLEFKLDADSGNMDSTAIGDWRNNQHVYVINRGYDEAGTHLGFKKVVFESVTSTVYLVRFSNLDGTNEINFQVTKGATYNFTFLSLNGNGQLASIEPPKEDWDVAFTQYTTVFYDEDPPLPYLVTGVMSNRNKVAVMQLFDKSFSEITSEDISQPAFSSKINTIGFDWKEYNFDTGIYDIFPEQNYIVKTTEGKHYKLHFIDFYDQNGKKGTPTFEFQEL